MQLCHSPVDQAAGVPFVLEFKVYPEIDDLLCCTGYLGEAFPLSIRYPQTDIWHTFFPFPDTADKLAEYAKKWKLEHAKSGEQVIP